MYRGSSYSRTHEIFYLLFDIHKSNFCWTDTCLRFRAINNDSDELNFFTTKYFYDPFKNIYSVSDVLHGAKCASSLPNMLRMNFCFNREQSRPKNIFSDS
jgi:hypothetical protein